jgi:hypothetical protein
MNLWNAKNAEFRNLVTVTEKGCQKAVQTEYALTINQHFILQSKTQHRCYNYMILALKLYK